MAVNVSAEKNRKNAKQNSLLTKAMNAKKGNSQSLLGDIKSEFGKITWTTREELIVYTKAVIGATLFIGFGVYLVDMAIQLGLNSLETLFRLIFG